MARRKTMREKSKPIPVGDLLETALPRLREPLTVSRLQRNWGGVVGPDVARRAEPVALTDGILQIAVDSSAWRQELSLRERELFHLIEQAIGGGVVRGLRFAFQSRVDAASPAVVRRVSRDGSVASGETAKIEEALAGLEDGALTVTLRRLFEKSSLAGLRSGEKG